jgi:DNA (cytosine-5)-methyltransferase 1
MVGRQPTVVSLFSGAGGLDWGFCQAGFHIVWANEFDQNAAETYRANIGDHLAEADINAISSEAIPACDVVIGGPPCQGFSVAGKMSPNDPRSKLVWQFVRVVREKKPTAFVMENVKALGTLDKWVGVREPVVAQLESLGYDVAHRVLDASNFGVPQQRERVFFIGTRRREAVTLYPEPLTKSVSVRDALRSLPPYGQPGNNSICRAVIVPAKRPVMRPSPYAGMLFNGLGRPIRLDRPAPTLPASMGGNKTPIVDQQALDTGEPNWVEDYHAHLRSGGQPYASVPSRMRRLTVEECAVIQSFPGAYRFAGKQSSRFAQIGNAVPPLLAFHVARRVMACLFEQPAGQSSAGRLP